MLVNKAYKFRIYPTQEQTVLINKTIGCSRFVFNRFLGRWNDTFKATGKGLTCESGHVQIVAYIMTEISTQVKIFYKKDSEF